MRLQLALNVSDIDEAVEFYSKLFDTEPYKRKPGYANFAIDEPPLKLVLFENPEGGGTLNHLGVETETADQVVAAEQRLTADGLDTSGVSETTCCRQVGDLGERSRRCSLGVVREAGRPRHLR